MKWWINDSIWNFKFARGGATNLKLEDFIRHRNLIIYGGTAIDYALRLKGEQIYPDEDLPYADYDVFSSNHQKDAYDYAELLFSEKEEYKETRAINALNIYTIKVGIGFNNFVLDCAYKPKDMLSKIPTLEYQGMKIVHPHFQYLDMHRALSIPYEGALSSFLDTLMLIDGKKI